MEHHPPDHAVEVHHQSRRRQPSLCAAGRRLHHRPPDGGLRVADRQAPQAVGAADRPGGPGWRADRLLVPVPVPGDVGLGGVLRHRADPRPPAHQPVLDGRQRRLRSAAGEAIVRVHRRRGPARRHRGLGAGVVRAANRIDEPAAAQRRLHALVRRACRGDHPARAGRGGSDRLGEGGEGSQRRRSLQSAARLQAPADHRARDQLRGPRRVHHRAAAEHGRPGREGRRGDRFDYRVSGAGRPVDVDDRFRRPDLADEQDSSLPGDRIRADGAPRQPRIHGSRDAAERRTLGAGPRARAGSVAAVHR